MKLKSYQELEEERKYEMELGAFVKVKCANCGITKQHPGEGGFLPDDRWFHCWNCRTALIGPGKLFTARITDWEKLVDFFTHTSLIEDTILISVMRRTWRFLPKEAPVLQMNNLGPSPKLHRETQAFMKSNKAELAKERAFQIRYSARYIHYLESGFGNQEIEYILRQLRAEKNVVLLCICDLKLKQFCHRLLLKEWLGTIPDIEKRIVGELVF